MEKARTDKQLKKISQYLLRRYDDSSCAM